MDIFEFGDAKLRLRDIDPLYRALHESGWSREKKCRYTLAFVSFDLAGLAGRIVDAGQAGFWSAMGAAMDQTKRGSPRRYFRGFEGHKALRWLENEYGTAMKALDALTGTFAEAEAVMNRWPQYGPTAIFKLCDMAERTCDVKISFEDVTPKQLMSNGMVTKGVHKAMGIDAPTDKDLEGFFHLLSVTKWATKAGPAYDRPLNMQEFETILCYYSHDDGKNRHLPGMDLQNILEELKGFNSKSARQLSAILEA